MVSSADNGPNETPDDRFARLIAAARDGDQNAVGVLIQECREYLLLIANQDLDDKVKPKLGASDVVQETLLTAQKSFAKFTGSCPHELRAWIRQILKHDLHEAHRKYKKVGKRQVRRETTIDDSQSPAALLPDAAYTPSTQAGLAEEARRLETAMSELPEDHQEVLRLRNWQRLSYAEIGEQIGRTEEAVRKLWGRAIVALRNKLESKKR